MRNIKAVFTKQILSFFRNPGMFGTPVAFLLFPFVMMLLLADAEMDLIVAQFVVMFVGISMIGTSHGFIAEDRATMNLRFMGMAGVKPYQYLISTCAALLFISLIALILFGLIGQHWGASFMSFLLISILGAFCSMLFGITLSLSKLGPFTPLFGMLLGIGPMFSEANEVLSNIFHFTYTQQVSNILRGEEGLTVSLTEPLQIILINMAVILFAFVFMNVTNGLDGERIAKKAST
ncbi:MAG: hypothetical protein FWE19_02970 [Oscillospiraceae bacterium]|nr:hypothetical protein [Oscillospiraceae bacterium]